MTSRSLVWNIKTSEKKIFLTFDDGPTEELTENILSILKDYKAKATFFCVGENAKNYPLLMQKIQLAGHTIGNHSYNHLNGWKNTTNDYKENIEKASKHIASTLFRPPYGRINYSQIKQLKTEYKIIMWSLLSGDFDVKISPQQCYDNVLQSRAGDIVVFHDNIKAQEKVLEVLPRYLKYFSELGFEFCRLDL